MTTTGSVPGSGPPDDRGEGDDVRGVVVARTGIQLAADASPETRVVVIEGNPLVRVGISAIVRGAGFDVVDVASAHAAADMRHVRADVVVVALDGADGSGAADVGLVRAAMPRARAVVIVDGPDDASVIGALLAGACGAILRQDATHEIVPAIRAAAEGESALSPAIASRLVRRLRLHERAHPGPSALTPRELDVLALLARGWDNPRIAGALHVGRGTVKHHISTILDKLGVDNRIQAAVEAVRLGLVDP